MTKSEDYCSPDMQHVFQRVRKKEKDYKSYHFSRHQNDILKTFFDLAQEFDSLQDFYRICVVVPAVYLKINVRLYLLDRTNNRLELVCDSKEGLPKGPKPLPDYLELTQEPYEFDNSYLVPISRKHYHGDAVQAQLLQRSLMGMLEIFPRQDLAGDDYFFFGKFANRIAYNLHNRRLMQQNIRHLEFINNLVMDIEHNVVIPNMYFRHLLKQLYKSLSRLGELTDQQSSFGGAATQFLEHLLLVKDELETNHRQLMDHHVTTSLFLESLFRRDHFKEGHLVLKTRSCLVEEEIIKPQLENYLSRFELYGIRIEYPMEKEEEVPLAVDIGLLAQVYANLFSNGVKYTSEIVREDRTIRKSLAYGRELCRDFFGVGKNGVKFNVFTTGPHLVPEDIARIFEDGYRGANSARNSGTGHGLSFVKQVVEIHGGRVGYESVEEGNNFFFVLPLSDSAAGSVK
jgi:signal transduction histidine kinase